MKTVLSYYKKYIPYILLTVLALFGQVWCELSLPKYMADIINNGIVTGDMEHIRNVGMIMIGIAVIAVACSIAGGFFAALTAARAARAIRKNLFNKVIRFSAAELNKFSIASLITRSTNDVQIIQQTTLTMMRLLMTAPIMGAGAVIMALKTSASLSWTLGLALICVCGLMIFSFVVIFPRFKMMQAKLDRINLIMKERLSGTLVVRAFRTEEHEENRFDSANIDLTKLYIFVNKALAFMMPTLMLIMSGVGVLIVWVGAHMVDSGELLIGDMLAYLQYAMLVIMSFMFVTMIFVMFPRAAVSAKRIGTVLDTEVSIADSEEPVAVHEKKGVIEFRNVSFSYPCAGERALADISFKAEPGKLTAIVGGTGCGKTTLVNLIPRFYDVSEGEILCDGVDIRTMAQDELRRNIGLVPQRGVLFSGTIRSNLLYGNENATEQELIEAAETAQAMEFVREKPNGLDEEISQGGTNVSGGQKQRLCIARALVRKPKIYVSDDSFSALDFATDKALRKSLRANVGDSTFIVVAQRINTIIDADRIIVLEDGRVVGDGRHGELMESCVVYRELALSQLSDEELEGIRKAALRKEVQ